MYGALELVTSNAKLLRSLTAVGHLNRRGYSKASRVFHPFYTNNISIQVDPRIHYANKVNVTIWKRKNTSPVLEFPLLRMLSIYRRSIHGDCIYDWNFVFFARMIASLVTRGDKIIYAFLAVNRIREKIWNQLNQSYLPPLGFNLQFQLRRSRGCRFTHSPCLRVYIPHWYTNFIIRISKRLFKLSASFHQHYMIISTCTLLSDSVPF